MLFDDIIISVQAFFYFSQSNRCSTLSSICKKFKLVKKKRYTEEIINNSLNVINKCIPHKRSTAISTCSSFS